MTCTICTCTCTICTCTCTTCTCTICTCTCIICTCTCTISIYYLEADSNFSLMSVLGVAILGK